MTNTYNLNKQVIHTKISIPKSEMVFAHFSKLKSREKNGDGEKQEIKMRLEGERVLQRREEIRMGCHWRERLRVSERGEETERAQETGDQESEREWGERRFRFRKLVRMAPFEK